MKIFVKKIRAKYFLTHYEINVDLGDKLLTILTQTEPNSGIPSPLPIAIDFLIDPKLISESAAINLRHFDAPPNQAHVTIEFRICPEDNEAFSITATRLFGHINEVVIKGENTTKIESIGDFQKRFKTHVSYFYPFVYFDLDFNWNHLNCLNFFAYNKLNNIDKTMKTIIGWHDNHAHSLSDDVNSQDFKNMLGILPQLRCLEERYYLKSLKSLANKVNEVFQQLTANRYSILFTLKTDKELKDLILDEGLRDSLQNITTMIRSGNDDIIWLHANDALKSIVQIATKIALTLQFGGSIVFLGSIDELRDYTEMDRVIAGVVERQHDQMSNFGQLDLVENIIDLCKSHNIQIILEYSGSVTAENCNIFMHNEFDDMEKLNAVDFDIEDFIQELEELFQNTEI